MSQDEQWLTLSQAAARLNVHPTTLRRWADNGDMPVMLTPGGHRRFSSEDVARIAQAHRMAPEEDAIEEMWADKALTQTRQEISQHKDDRWMVRLDEASREHHRLLGKRLMGLTLRFLAADDQGESLLAEAHAIGEAYGASAIELELPLADALEAAMFFRDTLVETAMHLPEETHVHPEANMRLLRRINTLLNTVHLAIAEVYDARYANRLSRS